MKNRLLYFTLAPARETFRRHVVIANLDSVMEPIRPFMPNVIPVPGLFVKDPQPLKDEKHQAFMESVNNGIIVRTNVIQGFFYLRPFAFGDNKLKWIAFILSQ